MAILSFGWEHVELTLLKSRRSWFTNGTESRQYGWPCLLETKVTETPKPNTSTQMTKKSTENGGKPRGRGFGGVNTNTKDGMRGGALETCCLRGGGNGTSGGGPAPEPSFFDLDIKNAGDAELWRHYYHNFGRTPDLDDSNIGQWKTHVRQCLLAREERLQLELHRGTDAKYKASVLISRMPTDLAFPEREGH